MSLREYRFMVPGKAVGKQRGRTFIPRKGDGTMVMKKDRWGQETNMPVTITKNPDETLNYQALVKQIAAEKIDTMLDRCRVFIIVGIPVRMKTFKTKPDRYEEPLVRPDLDNVVKAILDALQGIAFKNDKHVMQVGAKYGLMHPEARPSTQVFIWEVVWNDFMVFDVPPSSTFAGIPTPLLIAGRSGAML